MKNEPIVLGLPKRFRELVHKSLDGSLVEQEVREIEQTLRVNKDARRWYTETVLLHNDLVAHGEASELCKQIHEEFPEPSATGLSRLARKLTPTRALSRWAIAASVLVATLGFGCGMGLYAASVIYVWPMFTAAPWNWKVGTDVIGKIESSNDAVWQASDVPHTLPTRGLRVGQQIRLASGSVSLSFRTGALVILEGPAVFELRSESGGKLFSGKLSVVTPDEISPFRVATSAGIASCGAGNFGIDVQSDSKSTSVRFHAISGSFHQQTAARFVSNNGNAQNLVHGESILVDLDGNIVADMTARPGEFHDRIPPVQWAHFHGDQIPLGNLFDDSKSASLSDAVLSDTYGAAGETLDLGVVAVQDGQLDVDVSLAERGVRFNLKNVGGGGPRVRGLPSNDTYRSVSSTPIRTSGEDFLAADLGAKIEDGVGMSTNELITFDLDELRQAGRLGRVPMQFRTGRVGLNDREPDSIPDRNLASARFVVIVSTADRVLAGYIDGYEYLVTKLGKVYQFDVAEEELPPVLGNDGRYVSFNAPIPAEARFLTLATLMCDVEHDDHAVFSGARLEIIRPMAVALNR